MPNGVTAVILAGGRGMRLRSVVSDRPKVLATVSGKPFLTYLLDQVAAAGIMEVVLCIGYRGKQIQAAFGELYHGMSLSYSQETNLLGTGGALRLALPLIASRAFVAMNGDLFCDVDLAHLWSWHYSRQSNATVVLSPKSDTARYGCVSLSADGTISSFEEKGSTAGAGWVNAGIYVINKGIIQSIPAGYVVSLEHDVFPEMVGKRFYGYQSWGRFLDIGTPESYAQADTRLIRMEEMDQKRFVVLDRDGTINVEREYLSDPDQLELLPGVANGLRHLRKLGLGLVVITKSIWYWSRLL